MFNSNFLSKMTKSRFNLRNVAKIAVPILAVCLMFASCGGKDKDKDGDPDDPGGSNTGKGVLIGGVRWATSNVDAPGTFAEKPESYGMFYQWNSKVGWKHSDPLTAVGGTSTWNPSWNGNGAAAWEKANDPCPAGWRMPSGVELEALIAAGYTAKTVNGISGMEFGKGSNTIFLPSAGEREDEEGRLKSVGTMGNYWSNARSGDEIAYYLNFFSSNTKVLTTNYRARGLSCRCVAVD